MSPTDKNTRPFSNAGWLPIVGYLIVLAMFYFASLGPHGRVWGFNWWAYLGDTYRYGLLGFGLILGAAVYILGRKRADNSPRAGQAENPVLYGALFAITALLLLTAFVVFRSTTHFLGDGYQLLARLANQEHAVKIWDKGAALIQSAIYFLCPGTPSARALLTFQIWSITSGAGFLIALIVLSRPLFDHYRDRFLFFLGVTLSGFSLMFFGYVENYATLTALTLIYLLMAVRVAQGKGSALWLILPLLLAVFVHMLGLLLVPSFLYLLLGQTSLGPMLGRLSGKNKLLVGVMLVLAMVLTYYLLYSRSYFFKFMLLPLVEDRFTVENDMLFSFKHLLDLANLLALLLPGLLVYLMALVSESSLRASLTAPAARFILISLSSALVAVWVLNPGIGMPRNWDLFSIVGVPLVVLCYFSAIQYCRIRRTSSAVPALMIILGALSLAPRVAVNASDDLAIAHLRDYFELDRARNRNARGLLIDYYLEKGEADLAEMESQRLLRDLPEVAACREAELLVDRGEFAKVIPLARRAVSINPLYWDAYANLGLSYRRTGMLDSAQVMLEIADGLNPYNARITSELGAVALMKREFVEAERLFVTALELDSTLMDPMYGLVSAYLQTNRIRESFEFVTMQYRHGFQDSTYFRQAGDTYVNRRLFDLASVAYSYATDRGLDSTYVIEVKSRFPQLGNR